MKKKLIIMLTGAAVVVSLLVVAQAMAADAAQNRLKKNDQTCENFVDEDKAGLCDYIPEEKHFRKRDGTLNPEGVADGKPYRPGPRPTTSETNKAEETAKVETREQVENSEQSTVTTDVQILIRDGSRESSTACGRDKFRLSKHQKIQRQDGTGGKGR